MDIEVGQHVKIMHRGKMTPARVQSKRFRAQPGRPGAPMTDKDGNFVVEFGLALTHEGRPVSRVPAFRLADKIFPA